MKKIIWALLPMGFLLTACSDNLTKSKAESIAKECIKKRPEKYSINIPLGASTYVSEEVAALYQKLAQQGYLKLNKRGSGAYDIFLTEKAKPFIDDDFNKTLKTYDLEFEKVAEVHEIPAFGGANVKIEFKKINKTPFSILDRNKETSIIREFAFTKTSDGWKGCD